MTIEELDIALLEQCTIESLLKGAGEMFKLRLNSDSSIASFQAQSTDFCTKSKMFLCAHHLDHNSSEANLSSIMKEFITVYKEKRIGETNQAMKYLFHKDIDTLYQQISMLTMHAQFKYVENIFQIDEKIARRSLDPNSVSLGMSLYLYYTILVNDYLDYLSYNELFTKAWYNYYDNWNSRILMFKMNGNNWKRQFDGVLLD